MKSLAIALLLAAQTAAQIEADAPPAAWAPIAADDLVAFETARGRVVVQLAPAFAPAHVAAIRALVRAHAFDGGAVVRVQDNYVVQWTARAAATAAEAGAPLAPSTGTTAAPATVAAPAAASELAAEYDRPAGGVHFAPTGSPDAYAAEAGFADGWPVARSGGRLWPVHCYGMVGAGRDNPPSTGDGSELYAVIGHAPRHLDRNLAVVGRVVAGIEAMAALPRGTEALGFYKTVAERTPITRATLASDLPAATRPRFEVMRTDTRDFAAYLEAKTNRREPFFVRPAGRVDVCNMRIPVRPAG